MKVIERGDPSPGSRVLFSDDEAKTDAGPLKCEWCGSELEVAADDVQEAEIRDADNDVVSWLFVECGHCRRPATISDSDIPSDLSVAIRIKALLSRSARS